jgi:hypothetical protein
MNNKGSHTSLNRNENQLTEIILTIVFTAIIIWSGIVLFGSNV